MQRYRLQFCRDFCTQCGTVVCVHLIRVWVLLKIEKNESQKMNISVIRTIIGMVCVSIDIDRSDNIRVAHLVHIILYLEFSRIRRMWNAIIVPFGVRQSAKQT